MELMGKRRTAHLWRRRNIEVKQKRPQRVKRKGSMWSKWRQECGERSGVEGKGRTAHRWRRRAIEGTRPTQRSRKVGNEVGRWLVETGC